MRDLSAGPRVLLKRLRELMAEPLEPQDTGEHPLAERLNMAYKGTLVTHGRAAGLVVATGARTQLGQDGGAFRHHCAVWQHEGRHLGERVQRLQLLARDGRPLPLTLSLVERHLLGSQAAAPQHLGDGDGAEFGRGCLGQ